MQKIDNAKFSLDGVSPPPSPYGRPARAPKLPDGIRIAMLVKQREHANQTIGSLRTTDGRREQLKKLAAREELHHAARVREECLRTYPNDVWGQFQYFFQKYSIPAAIGRPRTVSDHTRALYIENVGYFLKSLAELNMKPRNLTELSEKHLKLCIRLWEKKKLSAPSLQSRFGNISRFLTWMGRTVHTTSVQDVVEVPASAIRSYSATRPKSWESRGIDVEAKIEEVAAICAMTAVQLRLEHAFGLRSAEALSIKPHESDRGTFLAVTRGTKGGLSRMVPIQTPAQRAVLEEAKAMANKRSGLLGRYGIRFEAARGHYYYVLKKVGLTRSAEGITAHGLRHGYANTRFEDLTGAPAPVVSQEKMAYADEMQARKKLSQELGHQRVQITTAYTGSVIHIQRSHRKAMEALLAAFDNQDLKAAFLALKTELALAGKQFSLYVVGPEAEGRPVPRGTNLRMSVLVESLDLAQPGDTAAHMLTALNAVRQLAPLVKAAQNRDVEMFEQRMFEASAVALPKLEIFF